MWVPTPYASVGAACSRHSPRDSLSLRVLPRLYGADAGRQEIEEVASKVQRSLISVS